jgi:hypothetical protein
VEQLWLAETGGMMMRKVTKAVVSLLLWVVALAVLAASAYGQTATLGTITGTISDPTGAAITNAKIVATNKATGVSQTTVTNDVGRFVLSDLPAATYDLVAEKEGFERCATRELVLHPADSVQFSCNLKVGATSETVEVSAESLMVQTEEAKVSRVIDANQIRDIPVNGRNYASLLGLQPGVVQEFAFNSNQGMNIFATESTHVNGLRGDSNNVIIEGVSSTRTRGNGATTAAPSVDAIGEINIVTSGYLPEYSRVGGGQIVIQMKSGTEQYHGSAYEFIRNDYFDASNFFSGGTPSRIRFNNFGYTIGGPVIPHKKKVFFFFSQEWTRWPNSYTYTATVPTALARQGNFSDYCPGSGCPTVPAYLNGVGGLVAGQPFPNNQIPQSLWSANGAAFVGAMAKPTTFGTANNFVSQIPNPQYNRTESLKVDVQLEKIKSHLAVSLRHFRSDNFDGGGSAASRLLNWNIQLPERGATADLVTTFSPTLVNDFTFGSTEDIVHVALFPGGAGNGLDRSSLGINFPFIFGNASKDVPGKIPTVNVTGFDHLGDFGGAYPSGSVGKIFQFQDVITKTHGAHVFKAGIWVEQDGENDHDQLQIFHDNLNGTFVFSGSSSQNPATTGAPLADVFLGNFDEYRELGFRYYTPWVSWQEGLFAQDSWKATRRLTISGGLRWDYFPPYKSRWCNFATFNPLFYSRQPGVQQTVDPTTGLVTGGNPFNGVAVPCNELPASGEGHFGVLGQPYNASTRDSINAQLVSLGMLRGLSPEIFQKHYRNFQPRLGFAWDPFGAGRTSIRGGGGVFYTHTALSDATLLGKNVPFQFGADVLGGKIDCPGAPLTAQRNCTGGQSTSGVPNPIPMTGGDLVSKIPVVYQWNLNVQHMLPQDTLIDVGYVGTRSQHNALNVDMNQLHLGTVEANPGVVTAALRPFPGFGNLFVGLNEANTQYDALQVSAQRRMNKGLQFGLSYTYSHAYDYGSNRFSNAIDSYNIKMNYGPPDWERHHIFLFNYVYDIPFFKSSASWTGKVLGGWQLAGVVAIESGTPFTVTAGSDFANVGGDNGEFADRVAGCNPNSGPKNFHQWFNTACFVPPAPGTFGNAGRNTVWGPGLKNWDFALFKNGPIFERLHYQFRFEAFNVLNHPSFSCVSCGMDVVQSDPGFGTINSMGDPRELQFGFKLTF